MSQKAIMCFLELWKKCQELGKKWPLKFLKPTRLALEENVNYATEDREPNGHHGTGDRQDEAMEHEDYDDDGHKGTGTGQGKAMDDEDHGDNGQAKGDLNHGGGGDKIPLDNDQAPGEDTPPTILSQLALPLCKAFLKLLSSESSYQQLVKLLKTADVSDVHLIAMMSILMNLLA
jgi:hypothetical protein